MLVTTDIRRVALYVLQLQTALECSYQDALQTVRDEAELAAETLKLSAEAIIIWCDHRIAPVDV